MKPFEAELKINNYKAHLAVLLDNVNSANKELEGVLREKDKSVKDMAGLSSILAQLHNEHYLLSESIKATNEGIKKREESLQKQERALEVNKSKTESELSQKTESTKKEVLVLEQTIKNYTEILNEKRKANEELEKVGKSLKESNELFGDINKEFGVELKSLGKQLSDKERELDTKEREGKKTLEKLNGDILSAQEEYRTESAKIAKADEYIKKKEGEFARRERDIQTITKRLKSLYQEVRPGIALKI